MTDWANCSASEMWRRRLQHLCAWRTNQKEILFQSYRSWSVHQLVCSGKETKYCRQSFIKRHCEVTKNQSIAVRSCEWKTSSGTHTVTVWGGGGARVRVTKPALSPIGYHVPLEEGNLLIEDASNNPQNRWRLIDRIIEWINEWTIEQLIYWLNLFFCFSVRFHRLLDPILRHIHLVLVRQVSRSIVMLQWHFFFDREIQ